MCLAVPGQLLSISNADASGDPLFRRGRVAFGGLVKEVSLACLPQAQPGQFVLVHAGIAIAQIDEHEARRTLALLAELDPPAGDGSHAIS